MLKFIKQREYFQLGERALNPYIIIQKDQDSYGV